MGSDRFRRCRADCGDLDPISADHMARRRSRARGYGRRDLQSSHDPRDRRNGRWWFALRSGPSRRGLQHGFALFATPSASAHWSISVKKSPLIAAVAEVLRQGESLLRALDDEKYRRKLRPAFNSAVGEHYRHCLDHFQSLLDGLDADEVNYDHRKRDPRIENDRKFALSETHRILSACQSIPENFLGCPINVRSKVNYEIDEAPLIASTVGREFMYAVAHAIHHYALIAVMCELMTLPLPARFGVAPAALKCHAAQPHAA